MIDQSRRPTPIDYSRAEKRFTVEQRVTINLIGTECRFNAVVRNVSRRGMRLDVEGCIVHAGTGVKVEWNDHILLGRIRHRRQRGTSTTLGVELFSSWESFLEEILARNAEQLDKARRETQTFASLAAHEIGETLSVLLVYMELLKNNPSGTDAGEFVDCASTAAMRIRDLTRDLLTLSQVSANLMQITPVNCNRVVSAEAANCRQLSHAAVTHERLPILMADGRELRMVFRTLISNALKFNRATEPRVHVAATYKGTEWMFSVSDNGIGIDPQNAERIFQPFVRLHNAAEYPGSGLGLTLARRIVENHGGRMWVESTPGAGSIFFFSIPARENPWE